jgi:hypothetical protein
MTTLIYSPKSSHGIKESLVNLVNEYSAKATYALASMGQNVALNANMLTDRYFEKVLGDTTSEFSKVNIQDIIQKSMAYKPNSSILDLHPITRVVSDSNKITYAGQVAEVLAQLQAQFNKQNDKPLSYSQAVKILSVYTTSHAAQQVALTIAADHDLVYRSNNEKAFDAQIGDGVAKIERLVQTAYNSVLYGQGGVVRPEDRATKLSQVLPMDKARQIAFAYGMSFQGAVFGQALAPGVGAFVGAVAYPALVSEGMRGISAPIARVSGELKERARKENNHMLFLASSYLGNVTQAIAATGMVGGANPAFLAYVATSAAASTLKEHNHTFAIDNITQREFATWMDTIFGSLLAYTSLSSGFNAATHLDNVAPMTIDQAVHNATPMAVAYLGAHVANDLLSMSTTKNKLLTRLKLGAELLVVYSLISGCTPTPTSLPPPVVKITENPPTKTSPTDQPSPTPVPSSTPTPAPLGCTVTNLNSGYPASGSSAGGGLPSVDVIINNIAYNLPSLLNMGNRNVLVEFTCGNGYSGKVLPLTINNSGGASAQLGDNGRYSFTIDQRVLSDYASSGQVLKIDAPNAKGVNEPIITFAVRLNPTPVPSQAQVAPSNTPRPLQVAPSSTPQLSLAETYDPAGCSWNEGLVRFIHLLSGKPVALKSDAPNFKYPPNTSNEFDVIGNRVYDDGSFWAKPLAAQLSDMQSILASLGLCARPTPQPGKPEGDGGGGGPGVKPVPGATNPPPPIDTPRPDT